jgi:predicted alpha/beta superfamily hydrolase
VALRIFVGHCGEAPRTTLVLTDGNGFMGLAVDMVRLMQIPGLLPPMLVVGVGYPEAAVLTDTIDQRSRHLTPTPSRHREGSGHADAFLRALRTELFPWLDARFPGAGDRIYFGHSLGGLFGAHALLTAPDTFGRYIVSSPSLWWDHHVVFEREEQRAATHDDLPARVYLGIGALETDEGRRLETANLPPDHPDRAARTYLDMVADVARFASALGSRRYPSLELTCRVFHDEFHATAAGVVLTHGLRRFFS